MRTLKRSLILILCSVVFSSAIAFSGLEKTFAANINSVALLSAITNFDTLQPYWYGAGLRSVSRQESQQLFSVHALLADQPYCNGWEKEKLSSALRSAYCTGCAIGTFSILIDARHQECNGNFLEALATLNTVKVTGQFDAQKLGVLKALDRTADAKKILQNNLCSSPTEWWCDGYIDYLWHVWYSPKNTATRIPSTQESPNSSSSQPYSPESQNGRLKLDGYWGVQIERDVPLVVTDALSLQSNDNYLAYVRVDSTKERQIEQRIMGQSTFSSACDLYGRIVFWAHDGSYLSETAQAFRVSGQFDVRFMTVVPEDTAAITPRVSFSEACFTEARQVVIHDVYVSFSD